MPFSNIQTTGRPLTIKDEGVSLNTDVDSIDFIGAGVAGSAVGNAITEDIGGSMANKETPVGIVNGSNKVFTVTNTPTAIFVNGMLQTEGATEDYTYVDATKTITFITVPAVHPDGSKSKLKSFF